MAAPEDWQRVAARGEIKPGEVLPARLGDSQIALAELDGQVFAFGAVCPHAYALLSQGYLEGCEIECPLHAARFDIKTGRGLDGPTTEGVPVYDVRIDGADVFVRRVQ